MIFIKVINQRVLQVAVTGQAGQILASSGLLGPRCRKPNQHQLGQIVRTLVQSTSNKQKVTSANNQQLIPIARNIALRPCYPAGGKQSTPGNKAFTISQSRPTSYFIATTQAHEIDQSTILDGTEAAGNSASLSQVSESLKQKVLSKKGQLLIKQNKYYQQQFNENEQAATVGTQKRLVVIMSWLGAREKHVEKYRQFYQERGFDVLSVKTSPFDLLLPNIGARKVAVDFVRFLQDKQYSDVLLHGFSVGSFMMGQFLLEVDKLEPGARDKIIDSIKGLVMDSMANIESCCPGVANTLASNRILVWLIENTVRTYLRLGYNITTKHYEKANEKMWSGPVKCPVLFISSKNDIISDHNVIKELARVWNKQGIETVQKTFENSPHVRHFHENNEIYVELVDKLLKRIRLI